MDEIPVNNRIAVLIEKYLHDDLLEDEQKELQHWTGEQPEHQALFEELTNGEKLQQALTDYHDSRINIREKIYAQVPEAAVPSSRKMFPWFRLAAAAVIAGSLYAGYWMFFDNNQQEMVPVVAEQSKYGDDIPAPTGNRAELVLSDGAVVVLDEAQNGMLARQGNVQVVKENEQLRYTGTGTEVRYNTLRTAKGGFFRLTLPDGSLVWLNAASSVRYPTAFTGKERRVEITGEAYFEIAPDQSKPFFVSMTTPAGMESEVQVYGTHFNVNSYDDEAAIKVTLLEGSIAVKNTSSVVKIMPGQQAWIGSDIKVKKSVDTDHVMAWKNGRFSFNKAGIEELMKEVARWYDVDEVIYKGQVSDQFNVSIQRDIPVSELLKMLEYTDQVHFRIAGKTIIVMP